MSAYQEIIVDEVDRVVTITLNRPDRLNAWTPTMAAEVERAVIDAGSREDVRCIVITGAGRGFCAGADMDGLQTIQSRASDGAGAAVGATVGEDTGALPFQDGPGPDLDAHYNGRFTYLYKCPKPIIAAINGPCAGIGFVFALYADFRFAAADAKFTTAFSQRGLIAEHGISWILPRLIGEAQALELLFTAKKFPGTEAARIGLVNEALEGAALMDHVREVAHHLAHNVSPRSVAIMKWQIRKAYFQSFDDALELADEAMNTSFATADFKEGVASFVERRAASFTGR